MNDRMDDRPARRWLTPSEALNRFKPPPCAMIGTPASQRQQPRYGFCLGDLGLLIERNTTSELLESTPVYRLPGAPNGLLGLVNLRGNLAPVFDLKHILHLDSDHEQRWLLVLDRGEHAVGVYIDGWPQTVVTDQALDRLPPLPPLLRSHVGNAYSRDNRVWLEFNHRSFFRTLANPSRESIDHAFTLPFC